jgi:cytoskeleton protein RodZ
MTEPDVAAPPAQADGPDQAAATGFGPALAQARVQAGLTVEQAAARLRLHPRQLQALEQEDLKALPAAAYVSGFVRNYARELKIDSHPLIQDLNAKLKLRGPGDHPLDLGSGGTVATPALDDRGWRHLVLAGIVIALACAGLIGVWMARSGGRAGETAGTPAHPATRAAPAETPPPAAAAPSAAAAPEAAVPGVSAASSAVPEGSAGTATASAGVPAAATATGPASVAAPAGSVGRPMTSGTMAAPDATRAPATPAPAGSGPTIGLVLRFNDRSWVEVTQPDGRILLSRNGEAGSMELLNTSMPMLVVLGRADAVQVEYRGQPVNLKPYVNNKGVAHLMFADGRITSGGQNNR